MYERIVVPLDGSTAAETAIAYARLVPSRFVRLVYVEPARTDVSPDFLAVARAKLRSSPEEVEAAYLERIAAALRSVGRTVECLVRIGDPAEQIIAAAGDADLILIASVHLGNGRLADGSVADRVVRHARIPTLVVRAEGAVCPDRFARVVVPLDGSAQAETALPTARRLGADLGAALHLVRIAEPGAAVDLVDVGLFSPKVYEATIAALTEEAERGLAAVHTREMGRGIAVSSDLRVGAPAAELLRVLKPDDLVVMTTHGAGGTVGWCIGGVAEKLLRRAPAPVVLLHARADGPAAAGIPAAAGRNSVQAPV
jgi:nucleotide-binding universal stress UspA family protein